MEDILEYTQFLDLNISENLLTDTSIIKLFETLSKFNGIQRIELAKIRKLAEKPLLLKQLLELIQNNYSITEINYEENAIGVESFNQIFELFEENHVLQSIKVTIPEQFLELFAYYSRPIYRYFLISDIY